MRKSKKTALMSIVSLCIFGAVCFTPAGFNAVKVEGPAVDQITNAVTETKIQTETTDEAADETETVLEDADTTQPIEDKLLHLISLNYCYNDALTSDEALILGAATTLYDYSYDAPGYGICVNSALIEGFIKSFYGKDIDVKSFENDSAPLGYIAVAPYEIGELYHSLVSVTETENGYETVSCLSDYYSGDCLDTCLLKCVFIKNDSSEFGYNLVSAETL